MRVAINNSRSYDINQADENSKINYGMTTFQTEGSKGCYYTLNSMFIMKHVLYVNSFEILRVIYI